MGVSSKTRLPIGILRQHGHVGRAKLRCTRRYWHAADAPRAVEICQTEMAARDTWYSDTLAE